MYQSIKERCEALSNNFKEISAERKSILENISTYIKQKIASKQSVQLNFICTHNSRRSHLGQVWAAVAADYYSISNVHTYSGGTEATAFNVNAINALKNAGFIIKAQENTSNPVFEVSFGENKKSLCFSKTF
ncbi:MAG: protein-tyrosine-phosphatase, partial [Pseudarcicella sp.]|nr:protein-tyrosine-phosphatase [Pseudarcicella sp.]